MKIVQRLFTLSTFVIGITAVSATPITGIVADAQTGEAIIGATIYDVTEKKGVILAPLRPFPQGKVRVGLKF